ncbi:uncharacterized protein RAG0_09937 [Rhynchosporium agropyri]|uniref:Uncharacterized protein n=1 Tax=Rhynchosporium agropyri TaxID=914238 RepID=A0A1E1KXU4_9HELO|nr:uncharacterized protein RAG0_09937 [Rhynchosporium agropyri]
MEDAAVISERISQKLMFVFGSLTEDTTITTPYLPTYSPARHMVIHAPQPQYQARPNHPLLTYPPIPKYTQHTSSSFQTPTRLLLTTWCPTSQEKSKLPTYLATNTTEPYNNNQHHTILSSLHQAPSEPSSSPPQRDSRPLTLYLI